MVDKFIDELDQATLYNNSDLIVIERNPSTTDETHYMELGDFLDNFYLRDTYKINRVASAGNFTVSITDQAGNNATADKPLYFSIGGVRRKLSGSLSLQINAADVFNYGASMFANLTQELFVYVGWRASTSTIFLLLSRLGHGNLYGDFQTVSTHEHYGAITGAAPVASDPVANIGRVTIRNSGTPNFNWDILLDTVIQRPIFQTSWLEYAPTPTGFTGTIPTGLYRYKLEYAQCSLFIRHTADGTSNAATFTIPLPIAARSITNMAWGGAAVVSDNGVVQTTPGVLRVLSAATVMDVYKTFSPGSGFTTSGGKRVAQMNPMIYEI